MKLTLEEKKTPHKIKDDGLSPHNGEYWYKCSVCGKSDWIASYGTFEQLNFYNTPCKGERLSNLK